MIAQVLVLKPECCEWAQNLQRRAQARQEKVRLDEGGCAAQHVLSLGVPLLFCVKGLVMSEEVPLRRQNVARYRRRGGADTHSAWHWAVKGHERRHNMTMGAECGRMGARGWAG